MIDPVSRRNHKDIGLFVAQVTQQSAKEPSRDSGITRTIHATECLVALVQEQHAGGHRVGDLQSLPHVRLSLANNAAHEGAEKYQLARLRNRDRFEGKVSEFAQAIAHAVMYTANHMDLEAIVALTESGSTPLWMSRIRSDIPIFAFTRHERTQRRVALYRGVYPIPFDIVHTDPDRLYRAISKVLIDRGHVAAGDEIILTLGELTGVSGGTNTMKLLEVVA